jgi:alpha-glucosidase
MFGQRVGEGMGKSPPTNWKSLGNNGWIFDTLRNEFYWSAFLPFQPDLNYRNPAVKEAMFDVVRFWLGRGVDGFRLDMFNALFEDSLLRDNPFSAKMIPSESNPDGYFQKAQYNMNQEESFTFAAELRKVLG